VVLELLHEGQRVASRDYGPIDSGRGAQPVLASFPSRDLPTGQYEARLTVRQGQISRQQLLPVTLAR